ncbi:MAG: amidohydrolase [Candidatus Neomarinimicrobiota bacterium]
MKAVNLSLSFYIVIFSFFHIGVVSGENPSRGDWTREKRSAAAWVDDNGNMLVAASQRIWQLAELALRENESSRLLSEILSENGFQVKRGVSQMPTAFVATYGSGKPVVAYLAEFDALPGLSQTVSARVEAKIPGGGGHGCGHNLFGVGSIGGALALQSAMKKHRLRGTIRVYGTPAEEQGIGKVFMVRDGLFEDVDVCLSWHPSNENKVTVQPSKALRSFEVTFFGRSAHASAAPWEGVSALDAVEALESGINLLREHMPETARIHYVVTEGGDAPNVIPSLASVWMFTRGKDWPEQEKVYHHVRRIIEAADMMAWGEEYGNAESGFRPAEVALFTGLYDYNINLEAGRMVQKNLELVGPPSFTEVEQAFARELQESFGLEPQGMHTEVIRFDPERAPEPGGSTDVANISWVAPTVGFGVANWPLKVPAHSWASTAASGSPAGLKAMSTAAKVLALSGIDALTDPGTMKVIRDEFIESRKKFDYGDAIGPDIQPALPSHMK